MFLKHKQPSPARAASGRQPAEVDEALELAGVARDEVAERGRVALDLREGALGRVAERQRPDEDAGGDAGARRDRAEPRSPPRERVASTNGIAPSARCTWPESGIEASAAAASHVFRRSTP